ncbi:MAG TPA: FAD-binding protein [Alphaproteobacteria bacterium]|nr:FAD-binding protein [Alphaproteobacteria bacterium]
MSSPDAIVVGGGLAGLAAAVAVAQAGLSIIHVAPKAPPDRRTSALMRPSVDFLQSTGLIGDPAAIGHPLTQIRIIDATERLIRAPETVFDAAESGLDAFAWNFPNATLMAAFEAARAQLPGLTAVAAAVTGVRRSAGRWQVTLADGEELACALLVGADGKKSMVRSAAGIHTRERVFAESALVADLDLGRPLDGASVEFHYPRGPFTLVPAGGKRANLVWIDSTEVLKQAQASGPESLRTTFLAKSQRLFGGIALQSPAAVFPLSTLSVAQAGTDGAVLVGEAAHAFPPIGAQGLNLGLRDVADLAASLAEAERRTPDWADAVSRDYARRRASDLSRTGTMVDALYRSLLSGFLPAQALRAAGLWALKLVPPLRRQAFNIGMGVR